MDINRACEIITENIKASATDSPGYYELKHHKPWFREVLKIIRSKEAG